MFNLNILRFQFVTSLKQLKSYIDLFITTTGRLSQHNSAVITDCPAWTTFQENRNKFRTKLSQSSIVYISIDLSNHDSISMGNYDIGKRCT